MTAYVNTKPPTIFAVRLERFMTTGRTSPALCSCVDVNGESMGEYVVKFFGGIELGKEGLGFELLGSQLATYFGINTPQPAIVEVETDFAKAVQITTNPGKGIINKSIGKNFGSRFIFPATTIPVGKPIDSNLLHKATTIFAFDALIQNADRRTDNPNLITSNNDLIVLDHELAFGFWADLTTNSEPWLLSESKFLQKHVFYSHLKSNKADFSEFYAKLNALSDEIINGLIIQCPETWKGNKLEKIVLHLQRMHDNADKFISSLNEVLK